MPHICIGGKAHEFQFTPLREGRLACKLRNARQNFISIHAPPRGATIKRGIHSARGYFNSRPSARGDCAGQEVRKMENHFNSRPSARGDPRRMRSKAIWLIFQFTPLREGRHVLHGCAGHWHSISIHAPPRGATCLLFGNQFTVDFNSRPSARGDGVVTWQAAFADNFNSRPSARGDGRTWYADYTYGEFQFTPLREGRPGRELQPCHSGLHFNSRPSARGDKHSSTRKRCMFYFNSRPSARGDAAKVKEVHAGTNFNSRPSARGDFRALPLMYT